MTILIVVLCILSLVLLITWAKINTFLAFLVVSVTAGLLLGIPITNISKSVNKGLGDTLGSVVIIIVLGAMLGKLVAESGSAQRIAGFMKNIFGYKYVLWAMMVTGFIVGIPLFFNVAFVLLVPIIFSVAYSYKLPHVYIGVPMIASLSIMHGFLPPHPAPMALVGQYHADMARTFFYGLIIATPAAIIAGPFYAKTVKKIKATSAKVFTIPDVPEHELPGIANSIISSLLPVIIIALTSVLSGVFNQVNGLNNLFTFLAEPNIVMLLTIIIATYTLGIRMGKKLSVIMDMYIDAVKDIAMILLIIGSAGILKQILVDSGVNDEVAAILKGWQLPPLLLAWIIAAILRLSLGSATIAGLTAGGIMYPLAMQTAIDPSLFVLSIGAGSLFCSHVNDTAFWMIKEYFGLSMKDTFRSWSVTETIVSVMGLLGVLVMNEIV